jgi:hypothetical protein
MHPESFGFSKHSSKEKATKENLSIMNYIWRCFSGPKHGHL